MSVSRSVSRADAPSGASHNEVKLVGRLGALPVSRRMPSGDVMVTWRVIAEREARSTGDRRVVDTLACVAFHQDVLREVGTWGPGDVVEVRGSLRRRFWRAAAGPVSRYEVEVLHARRVAAGVPGDGEPPSACGEGPQEEPRTRLRAE